MAHGRMSSAPAFRSSGDLLADRRYDYAAAALAERDFVAAADLFAQAAEVAPCWAAAWFGLGQAREALAQKDAAAEAFTRARECDAHDELGAGLHLARLTGASPASPPADYVRGLFDQYAGRFDRHLREELGYRGPELLRDALSAARAERSQPLHFDRVLDLGCGTGLMGRALFPHFDSIHGVDLSPAWSRRRARPASTTRPRPAISSISCAGRARTAPISSSPPTCSSISAISRPSFARARARSRAAGSSPSPCSAAGADYERSATDLRYAHSGRLSASPRGGARLQGRVAASRPRRARTPGATCRGWSAVMVRA
jgi:hypothetical protein